MPLALREQAAENRRQTHHEGSHDFLASVHDLVLHARELVIDLRQTNSEFFELPITGRLGPVKCLLL